MNDVRLKFEPPHMKFWLSLSWGFATSQKTVDSPFNSVSHQHVFLPMPMMADSDDDQTGIPLIERLSETPPPASKRTSKRKRDEEDGEAAEKKAAKKKRRTKKKPHDVEDEALDSVLGINRAIAHMDSSLMADHIAQRTRRFQPDLNLVETEDIHIPGTSEPGIMSSSDGY